MTRYWPLIFIAAGLSLLVAGFFYDVMFAGIPYQDPTPEMGASYARHAHIASVTSWIGLTVFLFGCIAGMIRLGVRRLRGADVS